MEPGSGGAQSQAEMEPQGWGSSLPGLNRSPTKRVEMGGLSWLGNGELCFP